MNTTEESGDCFICFSKKEKHVFLPVDSAQKFQEVVNDCMNFLHEDIADSCKSNTGNSNIEKRPPFCKKCFDSVTELTQLNEQSSKLKKKISDKKIAFSMAVFFRRNQIEDGNEDYDDLNHSQKQLIIQLDVTGIPPSLFSINPSISAAVGDLEHPVENSSVGMDVLVEEDPQPIGPEFLPCDSSLKESNQSDTSTSISKKSSTPQPSFSSGAGTRKNSLRANRSNKKAEQRNCVKIRGTTDNGKLKTTTTLCSYCRKSFLSIATLKTHERRFLTENTDNKSVFYDKVFVESSKLQEHISVHTIKKSYKCSFCEKGYASPSSVRIHERIHTGEKPYKCSYCKKGFAQQSNFRAHERTHTGEKPHKCPFCEKTCSNTYNLKKHIKSHTGEKPVCLFCGKAFNSSAVLKVHERTHTGEKPYKCSFCEKTFSILNTLQNHIRRHTGEKPYKCSICGKDYASISSLSAHKKRHT